MSCKAGQAGVPAWGPSTLVLAPVSDSPPGMTQVIVTLFLLTSDLHHPVTRSDVIPDS